MVSCRVCDNDTGNVLFNAYEMMFGFRDEFEYYQCSRCGCLQIKEIPCDMSKYYPDNYYSFNVRGENNISKSILTKIKLSLKKSIIKYSFKTKISSLFMTKIYQLPSWAEWLKIAGMGLDNSILDVGCGTGHLILEMHKLGFSNLTGIDPYITQGVCHVNGVQILKNTLGELKCKYDFIMLNHSFEHMDDPLSTLNNIHAHLSDDGFTLIRIPVANYAWENYGVNWYQLDAPRHFFLHTEKSMQILANKGRFKLLKIIYDSTALQFWISESYSKYILSGAG
jgi:2-polyprenyl-3-methyl-5-hydroxy-6-metoxy-1,4-benzoquinol methylase